MICNSREAAAGREKEIVERFAQELNNRLVALIPKDPIVQLCERKAVTVIEGAPNSQMANVYRSLARKIMSGDDSLKRRKSKHTDEKPDPIRAELLKISGHAKGEDLAVASV